MTTRTQLLEQLAAAETNLTIARREADTAWDTYDEVIELRALEMATNEDIQYSASKAENLDLVYFEAYKQVDEIKAVLLELDALDTYAAEMREGREAWSSVKIDGLFKSQVAHSTEAVLMLGSQKSEDSFEKVNACFYAAVALAHQLAPTL